MTAKRLFVGRKTVEDRFIIINDYDGEIGVKENRSGDVLVLKHSDLNAQQFVAQLVVFLNDQNQAIVDLYDGSKYWSDKATEKIKELEKENERLKQNIDELLSVDIEEELLKENEQLKQAYTQLKHRHSLLHDVCIDAECDRDSYCKDIASLEKENEQLKSESENLKKSIECMDETVKEQCIKLDWASECGVKWDKEFKNWKGYE